MRAGRSAWRWPTWPAPIPRWGGTLPPPSGRAGTAPTPPIPAPRSPGSADASGSFAMPSEQQCSRGERPAGHADPHLDRDNAATGRESGDQLRFDGWLELLTVVSRLVAAASGGDVEATDMPVQGTEPAAEKHHQREG